MKTAIRINNKEEYDTLMVYLEERGYRCSGGTRPKDWRIGDYASYPIVIYLKMNDLGYDRMINLNKDKYNLITIEKFMNKFKVGQKVKILTDKDNQINQIWTIIKVDNSDIPYKLESVNDRISWYQEHELQLLEKTWETLEVGDVIDCIKPVGEEKTILEVGVTRNAYLLSFVNKKEKAEGWYTIKEAKEIGWRIKDETPEEEMIDIKGKKWSISTITEALKKYAN